MGRGRDGTIKHDLWVIRTKTGTHKVEVRLAVEGEVHFIAEMPDGEKITGTNLNQLRLSVEAIFLGIEIAKWEKIIEISVTGEYARRENAAEIDLSWRIYWRAKRSDGRTLVKYTEDGPIGHPCTARGCERIIPYTEEAEAFLNAAAESIRSLRKKLEDFFHADDLELRIAENAPLLLAAEPKQEGET
jgi:hypothetical protein